MRSIGWAALAVALAGPATAADLSVAPVQRGLKPAPYEWEWSGLYVGGNVGYRGATIVGNPDLESTSPIVNSNTSSSSNGAIGGIQVGINWQVEKLVFGFEGDVDGMTAGSATSSGACLSSGAAIPGCSFAVVDRLRYFVTLRARLGYAIDRWLLYATGGAVWQNIGSDVSLSTTSTAPTVLGTVWNTPVGWTVGGGIAAAVTENWSVRIEYLHLQSFDAKASVAVSDAATSVFSLPAATTSADTVRVKNDIVRVGLDYRMW
jgi:outer membrane immunogenic protein